MKGNNIRSETERVKERVRERGKGREREREGGGETRETVKLRETKEK